MILTYDVFDEKYIALDNCCFVRLNVTQDYGWLSAKIERFYFCVISIDKSTPYRSWSDGYDKKNRDKKHLSITTILL